ncbi:MAG: DUF3047 domain-containing protein [Deltaproteobacteria bacterium]|nr:DUF3047 domain-containing protein [Deltaproteobacteria bacterium]
MRFAGRFHIAALSCVLLAASAPAAFPAPDVQRVVIDDFSAGVPGAPPPGWKDYRLPRKKNPTVYRVEKDGEDRFLKAESSEAASAIYKELRFDIRKTPILRWRWKVDHTLKKGDEARQGGDDYAARIYVTFEYEPDKATFFEKVKRAFAEKLFGIRLPGNTVNYIWANRLPRNRSAPNPFTDKVVMVAVESGNIYAGRWMNEERDVYADYRRLFNDEPPAVTGIVIMTDTDNTRESAAGYYGAISFNAR